MTLPAKGQAHRGEVAGSICSRLHHPRDPWAAATHERLLANIITMVTDHRRRKPAATAGIASA
jgi:hypothetical protein